MQHSGTQHKEACEEKRSSCPVLNHREVNIHIFLLQDLAPSAIARTVRMR